FLGSFLAGAVARVHRARRGRAALPARMREGPRAGWTCVPLDGAVFVVRRGASAAPEDPGAGAPARRPARGLRRVRLPGAARGVGAEGTGERELVHQARAP